MCVSLSRGKYIHTTSRCTYVVRLQETNTKGAIEMVTKMFLSCTIFLAILNSFEAYRILVMFPMMSKSHNILGQAITNHLLEAGHEVVFFTSYPKTEPIANLTEFDCSPIAAELVKQTDIFGPFKLQSLLAQKNVADSLDFLYFNYNLNRIFLEYEQVKEFLSDPREKFDLVVMEWFFSEIISGVPPLFQCPFIWIGSTEVHGQILRIIDEVPNPAYNSDLFSTNSPPFTFWGRITELAKASWKHFLLNYIIVPMEKDLFNRIYPEISAKRGVPMPSYEEAANNASLMLINSHPSVGSPFRLPQNVKYIGGYHIDRKVKPLPMDIQKTMDESKHGVIYFSMGSNLQSKDMSTEMKQSLLKMFGSLKQDVIWKFEDAMDNVPPNVHLVQWAPQTSILAHPNLKLFITHGGQLSTTEAVHFGVPIIGMPVFGDQYVNMLSVLKKGFGLMLQLNEDVSENLKTMIGKVLENPEYANKAKFVSSIYHDRLATPGDELIYWIEHVIKTAGAFHLRSPAFMVPWYQKMYLDLAVVLVLIGYFLVNSCKVGYKTQKRSGKKMKKN